MGVDTTDLESKRFAFSDSEGGDDLGSEGESPPRDEPMSPLLPLMILILMTLTLLSQSPTEPSLCLFHFNTLFQFVDFVFPFRVVLVAQLAKGVSF